MESVGFKEWAVVCEALGCGEQTVILRKGGIAEGRGGFQFRHQEFFLFPTWFHEQPAKVRGSGFEFPPPAPDKIDIKYFARIDSSSVITSWKTAEALEAFHILRPEVVRERFDYKKGPSLHVAFVRDISTSTTVDTCCREEIRRLSILGGPTGACGRSSLGTGPHRF